jgi:hypothetical protein
MMRKYWYLGMHLSPHSLRTVENRRYYFYLTFFQLMLEKRQERERDHTRHTVEIRQLEHSLNSRERMYKERIAGLEDQV